MFQLNAGKRLAKINEFARAHKIGSFEMAKNFVAKGFLNLNSEKGLI